MNESKKWNVGDIGYVVKTPHNYREPLVFNPENTVKVITVGNKYITTETCHGEKDQFFKKEEEKYDRYSNGFPIKDYIDRELLYFSKEDVELDNHRNKLISEIHEFGDSVKLSRLSIDTLQKIKELMEDVNNV